MIQRRVKKQWSSVPYTVSGYTIPETLLLRDMEINGELEKSAGCQCERQDSAH